MSSFERVDNVSRGKDISAQQILYIFSATIFLSAFLLFSVQPFFAKMVLPRLGGSPGVWSVAMVFFQSVLLLGYCYSHFITKYLQLRHAVALHAVVLLTAFVFLPIAIPAGWDTPPESGQAFWLLALFGVSVGLPFFGVSTTGPLMQAWFARTGHPHASDPYFLYGASNIGSFASLFLFVALFEPWFAVTAQSHMWTAGFGALAAMIMLCGYLTIRQSPATSSQSVLVQAKAGDTERPTTLQVLRWIGLAFVPSGMLVAVTAHISTDVAAAPLLWVIPLSLYLLTFVFAFQRNPLVSAATLSRYIPWTAAVMVIVFYASTHMPIWLVLGGNIGAFFVAALICHSILASYRPPAANLTSFYMWMSFGGVLGGIFASIVSPVTFDWIAEYPILVLALLFCSSSIYRVGRNNSIKIATFGILASITLYLAFSLGLLPAFEKNGVVAVCVIALAVLAALARLRSQAMFLVLVAVMIPLVVINQQVKNGVYAERSFFGVLRVTETADGGYRKLLHGTTLHGAMAIDDRSQAEKPEPLTYYHESGAIAVALRAAQEAKGGRIGHGAIVGLGTGSLLCHKRSGEEWTVYEIDKSIIDTASDPKHFRFVPECAPDTTMVLGDARIMLDKEPPAKFDYLLIDAFSSDSIPVHLLTREAVRMYMDKLTDDGLLVLHISNRYFEMESLVAAIARDEGLLVKQTRIVGPKDHRHSELILGPHVAVMARSEDALGSIATDERWFVPDPKDTEAWTDDYSDILSALLRKY